MSDYVILCCKCLKLKSKSDFSKSQIKRKDTKICLKCMTVSKPLEIIKELKQDKRGLSSTYTLFKPLSGVEGDKADQMMCLTMHQPWASLFVYGIKRAEGRGWNSDFRGRLWIHAAAKEPSPDTIALYEEKYREIYKQHGDDIDIMFPKHYPTSALIGYVDVVDVISMETAQSIPLPDTVIQEEIGSPYIFLCQNYRRLILPFSLSGEHKIWRMNSRDCKASKGIMKDSQSPFPIDYYSIMCKYYCKKD